MKLKSVLFVVLGMGMAVSSFAQMNIEFGAKGGFNFSGLNLSPGGKLYSTKYHTALGFHIGGYALIKLTKVSIQPEILYSSQGQYFTTSTYSNLKTTLNYLNIPVMVKYNLGGSPLYIQAGPQFGILVSSKGDLNQIENGFIAGQPTFNQNLNRYLNSTDFGIAFGAGIKLPAKLDASIRYTIGITDINKNSAGSTFAGGLQPSFSTAYTRNQVFQVSVGYMLRKFGK
jgi:hypothetical protein